MTDHANPWLLAFLIGGCAVFLIVILSPFFGIGVARRIRQQRLEQERTELDNDQTPRPPQDPGIRLW